MGVFFVDQFHRTRVVAVASSSLVSFLLAVKRKGTERKGEHTHTHKMPGERANGRENEGLKSYSITILVGKKSPHCNAHFTCT
jgi:hypothetical protein